MPEQHDAVLDIGVNLETLTKEFEQIKAKVKELGSQLEKATSQQAFGKGAVKGVQDYGVALKGVETSFDRLIRAQEQYSIAVKNHKDALKAAVKEQGDFATAVKSTKVREAAAAMQVARDNLFDVTKAYNRARQASKGFLDRLIENEKGILNFSKRLDVAIKKIVTYRIAWAGFRAASEAVRDAYEEVIKFDSTLRDLQKVLRTTEGNLDVLKRSAYDLGIAYGRSAIEVAGAFKTFAQQGLDVQGIISRTNTLMLAVSSTTLDTKGAVEALTAASEIYANEIDDLTIVVDKWLAAERNVAVTAADFADSLKGIGVVAQNLGLTMDELFGIVGAVGEITRKSGKAISNSFRTILARATSEEAIKVFQRYGIAVLTTAREMRPFGDILRDLAGRWQNLTKEAQLNIAVTLGQRRRYSDFLALMNNFNQFLATTRDSQLALGDAQLATISETEKLERRLQAVSTRFSELKEAVGRGLVEQLIRIAERFSGLTTAYTDNAQEVSSLISLNTQLIAGISIAALGFGGLGSSLRATGKWMSTLKVGTEALSTSFTTAGLAVTALRTSLLGIAGVALLVYDAYQLIQLAYAEQRDDQEQLKRIVDETTASQEAYNKKLAESRGKMEEFQKQAARAQIQSFIINMEKQIIDLNTQIDESTGKIENLQNRSGIIAALTAALPNQFSALLGGSQQDFLDEVELRRRNRLLKKLNEEIVRGYEERKRYYSDPKYKPDPEDWNAGSIFAYRTAIQEAQKALVQLQTAQEAGTDFKGFDISFLGKEFAKYFQNEMSKGIISTSGAKVEAWFQSIIREFEGKLELNLKVVPELETKDQEDFARRIFTNAVQEKVDRIVFRVSTLEQVMENNVKLAGLFGKEFNRAEEELKVIEDAVNSVMGKRLEISAEIYALTKQAKRDTSETQLGPEKIAEINSKIEDRKQSIIILDETLKKLYQDQAAEIRKNVKILRGQYVTQLQIETLNQKIKQDAERQAELLKAVSSAQVGVSRSRLLDIGTLRKQITLEKSILGIKYKAERDALDNNKALAESVGDWEEVLNIQENIVRLTETYKSNLLSADTKVLSNAIRESAAIRNTIIQSISSGLAGIPQNIVDRTKAEEQLAERRKQLELELQLARREGDAAAINQALRGLQELELEAKEVGSIMGDIFDALGTMAETRFQFLTDRLVEDITNLTIGETSIAQQLTIGVTNGTAAGAVQLENALISGATKGANILVDTLELIFRQIGVELGTGVKQKIKEGLVEGSETAKVNLDRTFEDGANTISTAVSAASQILGQIIGGGGKGAGIGSGFGGIAGSIVSSLFSLTPGGAAATAITSGLSLAGGLFGGIFDDHDYLDPFVDLKEETKKNTAAIENNNKLLELTREFINAPSRFIAPATQGVTYGFGTGSIQISVNADSSTDGAKLGRDIGRGLVESFSDTARTNRSRTSRFDR